MSGISLMDRGFEEVGYLFRCRGIISKPGLTPLPPFQSAVMGLLSEGSPLNWDETKRYADHVRKHGIIQFLNIYHKVKDRQKDVLKWGDE
eukprot:g29613.t1